VTTRRVKVEPAVLDDRARALGSVDLPESARHYVKNVLRLDDGSALELFDGQGTLARGRLAGLALVDVAWTTASAVLPPFVVAQAMVRGTKLDEVAQRATELGLAELWPFHAARSVVDGDRLKVERLRRVVDDAARQSGRATVPSVSAALTFDELCARVRAFSGVAAVGALDATRPLSEVLVERRLVLGEHGIIVVIGPEGGLDARELDALIRVGAIAVRLGAHTLRTETAALVALAAAQAALGAL
jgi:16S rRNA (uracil1498-N3)-methyltransferase